MNGEDFATTWDLDTRTSTQKVTNKDVLVDRVWGPKGLDRPWPSSYSPKMAKRRNVWGKHPCLGHIISNHIISCHFKLCHTISHRFISNHIVSFHDMTHQFISFHVISFHFKTFNFIPYHIISFHVASLSFHVHTISYHIILYQIISQYFILRQIIT
jgi:hypothetical protein